MCLSAPWLKRTRLQSSTLFFFHEVRWKERGEGVVKLLKHPDNGLAYFKFQLHGSMKIVGRWPPSLGLGAGRGYVPLT